MTLSNMRYKREKRSFEKVIRRVEMNEACESRKGEWRKKGM